LRYHYFWLILCSLLDQLGGAAIGPRYALIAGTLWCGIGLMCIVSLYLRFFDPGGARRIRQRSLMGIALLGVTGLDIIPSAFYLVVYSTGVRGVFPRSVEWWNEQIDGWVFSALWQPHNVAALIACLTGFLVLWHASAAASRGDTLLSAVVAGAAFASAAGTAIYVTFVFAVFLVVWTIVTLVKKWRRETVGLAIAGVVAALLALPYLRDLSGPAAGGQFLRLTVRSFFPAEDYLFALGWNQWWMRAIVDALLLPLNYFLELGFFFVIADLQLKRFGDRLHCPKALSLRRVDSAACPRFSLAALSRPDTCALLMLATSVTICTFLRSGVIVQNDLGWRGFMIAQFVLLIWGANYLGDRLHCPKAPPLRRVDSAACHRFSPAWKVSPGGRKALTAFLVLGAMGTVFDVVVQRMDLALCDAGKIPVFEWLPSDRDIARRAYANRVAYDWVRKHTPKSAIVQQNPDVQVQDTFYLLYANRRTVAADRSCGTEFGGNAQACPPLLTPLKKLYSAGTDPAMVRAVCGAMPISLLVAHDTDPAWSDRHSWVWTRKPEFANDFVRVFRCDAND
jgi:hypothetical protein